MFSDPERRHETEITMRGLKQVFIFYSVGGTLLHVMIFLTRHDYLNFV